MYLMVTDETNRLPKPDVDFFIYGRLFFPIELLGPLDDEVRKIRNEAGYKPDDHFKFDTNARPIHVSLDKCTEAKRRIVKFCLHNGCKFIAYVILHDIAKNKNQKETVMWAADHVIGRFNKYLFHNNEIGICVVDSLPVDGQFQFLSEKFTNGLKLEGGKNVALDRIKMFAATCLNASHANSAMDIVLGSFRYCVNNPQNIEAAREMMVNVLKMMWHVREGDTFHIAGKGLITRPKIENVQVEAYKDKYRELYKHINVLIADGK